MKSLRVGRRASYADDLFQPPAQTDKQKSPVLEELGRLALEIVADELEYPAGNEEEKDDTPKAGDKERDRDQHDRQRDHRDPEAVRNAVYRMLVRFGVLFYPV